MMPDDITMTIPLPHAARNTDATPSSSIDAAETKMRKKKIKKKKKKEKEAETKWEKNKWRNK